MATTEHPEKVAFKRRFVYEISRQLFEGGSTNYLIISQDPYYVQFPVEKGANQIICEAVSNQNLPEKAQLDRDQIDGLSHHGFTLLEKENGGNFQRICEVSHAEHLPLLAELISDVMFTIYGCELEQSIKFESQLE